MSTDQMPASEELSAALEDVRRIRSLLDDLEQNHRLLGLFRPLLMIALPFAPVAVVYGLLCQWAMDAPGAAWMGLPKAAWFWGLSLAVVVFGTAIKWSAYRGAARRMSVSHEELLKSLLDTGYPRIYVPIVAIFFATSALMVQMGAAHHIVGLLLMTTGAIFIAAPLVVRIKNMQYVGIFALLSGISSLFLWPEYPFYKVSVLYGIQFAWFGYLGLRLPRETG